MTGEELALLTDLYQLTMAQAYFDSHHSGIATFSLFIRAYPPDRGYFVAAGLQDVLEFLETFHVTEGGLRYLKSTGLFTDSFLDFLGALKFTGDVWALPEGTVFFKDEPIVEVTAPIIEAQIVETFIINQINLQSMIATKAARCIHAAEGRAVVDFALRRTQGTDAGMKVARASYLAGFAGTSNVHAGQVYGIPVVGTMAHSFVSSFPDETEAFRAFVRSFPKNSTLLIDTYDTIAGARKAAEIGRELGARGERLSGVRIDSGDLPGLARQVRRILDDAGLTETKIIGSGGLDEYDLAEFSVRSVPYDSYGVGTRMGVSADQPWLDIAYKLVEFAGRPVLKLSSGKESWPGKKQLYRSYDRRGAFEKDLIALRDEVIENAQPLLCNVMANGKRTAISPRLQAVRSHFENEFRRLPDAFKSIRSPASYPIALSPRVMELRTVAEHWHRSADSQA
jgi:nicotinate phosphoribosyltransferase